MELVKTEYIIQANLREAQEEDYEDLEKYVKGFALAAGAPPIKDGKPRMVFISAWIVHEGRNLNGDAFVGEELKSRVKEGLFVPPYSGMIDLDHDFVARGFWYKTSFAFDDRAKKWGILAHGAIWAWRFPELSDALLAEMQRRGAIDFSMGALSESFEITTSFPEFEGQHTRIMHNPVFLVTTILTIPPGDENAQGVASEDPTKMEPSPEMITSDATLATLPGKMEELKMENELKELKEAIANVLANKETSEKAFNLLQSFIDTQRADVIKAVEARQDAEEKVSTLQTEKASLEVALESANNVKADLEKELAEVKEKLAIFEAKEQAAKEDETLDARLSELPDVIIDNLEKHPEKEAILASWKRLDGVQWMEVQNILTLASSTSMKSKSDAEGQLGVFRKTEGSSLKAFLK